MDDRPDAQATHSFWACDQGQVGQFINGYRSAWLPASLLAGGSRSRLVDAFALAILGSEGPPAFTGMPGKGPDLAAARADAERIGKAMTELLRAVPGDGSYISESDYFEPRWQTSFWGRHFARLAGVKRQYDPSGLFFVHHGVGSEAWSADGFERL